MQASAKALVDVSVGSITRAFIEANAAMALWLQSLVLGVLARSRASTSTGSDLDSWMADYGFARLGAQYASGVVAFSRFTAGASVTIPAGTTVQTADGAWQYTTTAPATLAPTQNTVQVSVAASTPGAGGNAAIGAVSTIVGGLSGVDTVTNAAAFVGGADAETDAAYRARFVVWVNGLSKATGSAIGAAIGAVKAGLTYTITENVTYAGTAQPGHFFVVVDDGTGSPSAGLLASVGSAVEAARGLTSTFAVFAPVVLTANVSVIVTVAGGYDAATVRSSVQLALASYINSLSLGQALPYSRLMQVIYDASPGVTNAATLTLNGGTADLAATAKQVIKAGAITVS
ncbi:baseplate protein [Aquabacterium olei]|uniref:Baseplate protein n=1 Tax=Aquabacterium olei TaxID=1296669 RepID=A0A2U8FQH3_9BURK|nr:baseplate protein [Aquabacterium olei]